MASVEAEPAGPGCAASTTNNMDSMAEAIPAAAPDHAGPIKDQLDIDRDAAALIAAGPDYTSRDDGPYKRFIFRPHNHFNGFNFAEAHDAYADLFINGIIARLAPYDEASSAYVDYSHHLVLLGPTFKDSKLYIEICTTCMLDEAARREARRQIYHAFTQYEIPYIRYALTDIKLSRIRIAFTKVARLYPVTEGTKVTKEP